MTTPHVPVIIVGGGQAGLSVSWHLQQRGIDHVVFERKRAMHAWRERRWDAFCLVTPNWQCQLPGWPYRGDDPDGFMVKAEILDYLDGFLKHVAPPLHEGVAVTRVRPRREGGHAVSTSGGEFTADAVVVASGGYDQPIVPGWATGLPANVLQLHSEEYKNAQALPPGAVLVVGCGQSGAQIAEDLHLSGRKVLLATGPSPRCARFYRGKDVVTWLAEMGYYEMPVDQHPLREGVRDNTNHYVTGRDGGRDIDLRRFAQQGMELFGRLVGCDEDTLRFEPNLGEHLDEADRIYNGINASIDRWIEQRGITAPPPSVYSAVWQPETEREAASLRDFGVSSVLWCIGYRPDFGWLDAPVFDGHGNPRHRRGVTSQRGLYFLGLPWLHTWGSGRFSAVSADAAHLAEQIHAEQVVAERSDTESPLRLTAPSRSAAA
jgi:putative flavoprotein involved in K+ transport